MPPLIPAESANFPALQQPQFDFWQAIVMQSWKDAGSNLPYQESQLINHSNYPVILQKNAGLLTQQELINPADLEAVPVQTDEKGKHELDIRDLHPVGTLGRGNMGMVVLVANKSSYKPDAELTPRFAMKVIKTHDSNTARRTRRANTEREILCSLHHPFLQNLYAHYESDKHSLLLLDFCPGGDLNVLRHKQPDKRFTETAARFYAAEVVDALEYVHEMGIVYRDLKPENILIQESGHVMLTDFDLSLKLVQEKEGKLAELLTSCRSNRRSSSTAVVRRSKYRRWWFNCRFVPNIQVLKRRVNQLKPKLQLRPKRKLAASNNRNGTYVFVGTEEYVAPEVLEGAEHGYAVDWWTLGVLLYELVYGCTPFKGRSRRETFGNILGKEPYFPGTRSCRQPSLLQDLIQRLLVKDPAHRLGAVHDTSEIKSHPFFSGVQWHALRHVSRPPFIPPPFSLLQFQDRARRKAAVQTASKARHPTASTATVVHSSSSLYNTSRSYHDKANTSYSFPCPSASSRKDSSPRSSINGGSRSLSWYSNGSATPHTPAPDGDDDDISVEDIFSECAARQTHLRQQPFELDF